MKKSEQNKLIQEILNSPKSNQDCKQFKKLQMHWYKKLEASTSYEDIERTGTNRNSFYDEYGGNIKHYSWAIAAKYNFATHAYYQKLRYFSWHARVTSNSPLFNASKPSKVLKIAPTTTLSPQNNVNNLISDPNPSSSLPKSSSISSNLLRTQKLSTVDAKILYLIGDGKGISEVSSFLRRYLSHHAPTTRKGPKGRPFSVYYVHTRLDKLLKSIEAGTIYVADKGGEVKKAGLAE